MPTIVFNLWQFVPYLLNRAGHRVAEAFTPELAPHAISLPMWRVLASLRNDGPQRLGALSRLTSIDASTLSRLVGQMEGKALLLRRRDGDDARAVTVSLTRRAIDVTDRIVPLAMQCEEVALRGMSDAEIAILKRLLLQVHDNFEALMQDKTAD